MLRDQLRATLLFSAVIAFGMMFSGPAAFAESFDKPLQTKVVDLGPSPYVTPKADIKLTCSYYPSFMVKQLDDPGNKGAVFISIVLTQPGHVTACTRRHGPEENVLPQDCDYFGGVKRDLVFIWDCDGISGGIGFRALDYKSRTKVFQDRMKPRYAGGSDLDFVLVTDKQITLRYLRVVTGDCSIPARGTACWITFKEKTGLKDAPMPKCTDYSGAEAGKAESVIGYPVEVSLFPKPSIKALANPVKCWAVD